MLRYRHYTDVVLKRRKCAGAPRGLVTSHHQRREKEGACCDYLLTYLLVRDQHKRVYVFMNKSAKRVPTRLCPWPSQKDSAVNVAGGGVLIINGISTQSCGGVLLEIKIRNQDSLALTWVVLKDTRLYLSTTDCNGGAALRPWRHLSIRAVYS